VDLKDFEVPRHSDRPLRSAARTALRASRSLLNDEQGESDDDDAFSERKRASVVSSSRKVPQTAKSTGRKIIMRKTISPGQVKALAAKSSGDATGKHTIIAVSSHH
jgi:hypothetical protein